MIDDLRLFFEDYPRQILQGLDLRPSDLPDGLMDRLLEYRRQSLFKLENAQTFRIDADAFWMMSELLNEMKSDGLDELFSQVELPFPTMILLPPLMGKDGLVHVNEGLMLGIVTKVNDTIWTERFNFQGDEAGPSSCAFLSRGMSATSIPTPTRELFRVGVGEDVSQDFIDRETEINRTCLGIAVAISTLLRHDGMLKAEEVSLYPRQQRRQAERSGKVLPDTLITKITLGKAGRAQVEAMKEDIAAEGRVGIARRTHWVRGHYMRSRSGKLVWRMPHLRGAGPLVKQLRHVRGSVSANTIEITPSVDAPKNKM